MARKALNNPKIEVLWESEVVEAHGSEEGEHSGAGRAWGTSCHVLSCAVHGAGAALCDAAG